MRERSQQVRKPPLMSIEPAGEPTIFNCTRECHIDSVDQMQPFRFFDLPRELRDEIYKLALVDIELGLDPPYLPEVKLENTFYAADTVVNKQFMAECEPIA